MKNIRPVRENAPKYTAKKQDFPNKIFPVMEDTSIIIQRSSSWGAKTKFPSKKKSSEELRMIYNFIFINKYTIKSFYLIYKLEEVFDTIIKPGYNVYFIANVSNGYLVV